MFPKFTEELAFDDAKFGKDEGQHRQFEDQAHDEVQRNKIADVRIEGKLVRNQAG